MGSEPAADAGQLYPAPDPGRHPGVGALCRQADRRRGGSRGSHAACGVVPGRVDREWAPGQGRRAYGAGVRPRRDCGFLRPPQFACRQSARRDLQQFRQHPPHGEGRHRSTSNSSRAAISRTAWTARAVRLPGAPPCWGWCSARSRTSSRRCPSRSAWWPTGPG